MALPLNSSAEDMIQAYEFELEVKGQHQEHKYIRVTSQDDTLMYQIW